MGWLDSLENTKATWPSEFWPNGITLFEGSMAKKRIVEGPIGNGWIDEVKTASGSVFIARWNRFVKDNTVPEGRRRVRGGAYEIGRKVHHGPGLRSKKDALKEWLKVCDSVIGKSTRLHPSQIAEKSFRWFTTEQFEKSRSPRWRETTQDTFNYYKDKLFPTDSETWR